MLQSNLDFCCVCNSYDTIQTYLQLKDGTWFHVCEKCIKENSDDELRREMELKLNYKKN